RLRESSGSSRFQPTQCPVWIIACTIQSLQSQVYGHTSIGAQLNATTGKPRFRGAAHPARARWSTPRLSSQGADQQPPTRNGLDRLEVLEHRRALVVAQVIAEGVAAIVVAEDRGVVDVLGLAARRVALAVVELLPGPAERVPVVVLAVVVLAPPVGWSPRRGEARGSPNARGPAELIVVQGSSLRDLVDRFALYCKFRRQSPRRRDQARRRDGLHHGLLTRDQHRAHAHLLVVAPPQIPRRAAVRLIARTIVEVTFD